RDALTEKIETVACGYHDADSRRAAYRVARLVHEGMRTDRDRPLRTASAEGVFHRTLAGFTGGGLEVGRERCGAGYLAPGIEDVRHVSYACCLLGGTKKQVVILAAVEPLSEPADLVEQRSLDDEEMASVVPRQQQVG